MDARAHDSKVSLLWRKLRRPVQSRSSLMKNSVRWAFCLYTGQIARQTGAYPSCCNMKRLEVFLLLPRRDTSPSQGYPQH